MGTPHPGESGTTRVRRGGVAGSCSLADIACFARAYLAFASISRWSLASASYSAAIFP